MITPRIPSPLPPVIFELVTAASRPHAPAQNDIVSRLLLAIRNGDSYAYEHGIRTAQYAVALGHAIGFTGGEIINLHHAAVLHDIGRLTLPAEVLIKDGPLTADEYAVVQSHPRAGVELLSSIPCLRPAALLVAHHHERWDGSGYPYGLKGPVTPLGSRVLAIADVFDTLVSQRQGTRARVREAALRLIQMLAGSQLDPQLVQWFVGLPCWPIQASRHDRSLLGAGCATPPKGGAPSPPMGPPPTLEE